MKRRTMFGLAVGAVVLAFAAAVSAQSSKVAYPEGYRSWRHVKSMVLFPNHPLANPFAGMHHVYANAKAMQGLRSGKYADGAVLVFDLLEGGPKDEAVVEGPRKLIGVMQRDRKRFAATGGWGFEGFAGDSKTQRLVTDGGQSCFSCHAGQDKTAYVFSKLRP
jgi:hypothetical protein